MMQNPIHNGKEFFIRRSGSILLVFLLLLGSIVLMDQFLNEQEKVRNDLYLHSSILSDDLKIKLNQIDTYLNLRVFYLDALSQEYDQENFRTLNNQLFTTLGNNHLIQLFLDSSVNILQLQLYKDPKYDSIDVINQDWVNKTNTQAYTQGILNSFQKYSNKESQSNWLNDDGYYVWRKLSLNNKLSYIGVFFNHFESLLFEDGQHSDLNIFIFLKGDIKKIQGQNQRFSTDVIEKINYATTDIVQYDDKEYVYFYRQLTDELYFVVTVNHSKIVLQSMKNNVSLFLVLVLALLIVAIIHDYFAKNRHLMQITMDAREKELVSSFYKSQLGHIMNTISEAFVRADSTYTIVEINQAGADMLGYSMNEMLGKVVTDFMTKPIDVKLRKNDGMYSCFEVSLVKKNGDYIYGLVNKSTIIKDNPILKEHYFLVSDITELITAQKNAEEANRSKSRFIANLSHEIRTPMNATIGYIYLLEQTKLDAQQKKYLEKMDYASNTLLEIIDEILDFSKIEADKVIAEKIPFNVYHVIKNAASLFENTAYRKDLKLLVDIDVDVPEYIIGDPYRLRQVIINLLSNAFKFTRCGEVAVNVAIIQSSESKLTVKDTSYCIIKICVSDTGIGIPEGRMDALFDPFVQADDSTTRIFGGTGLGLAICQKLVNLMEGVVYARSIEQEGSQFYIELPVRVTNHDAIVYQNKIPNGYLVQESFKKILIVEDNLLNQELMVELLKQHGHKVVVANNGKVAMDILSKEHTPGFDLILMDIQMPIQDGYTTTRLIRSLPAYEKIPIIAVTANADKETQILLAESGMNDYVLKPINSEDLYIKVNIWNT